jgi:hypothetical protein
MSFDDLIPVIAFIAYIGFVVFKKILGKKKELPKGKPAKKVTFGFSKLINTIKSEIEKAANQGKLKEKQASDPSQKNLWEELREGNLEKETLEPDENIAEQDLEIDDTLFDTVKKPTEPVDEPLVKDSKKHAYRIYKPESGIIRKRRRRKKWCLSSYKLREAVVLSEILAKPIGLREE